MKRNKHSLLYVLVLGLILSTAFSLNFQVSAASSSFVTRANDNFTLDGKPFYVTGTNNHYLQFAPKSEVDKVLSDAAAMKLNAIRIWGFLDIGSLDRSVATSWNSYGPNAYDLNAKGAYFQYWDSKTNKPAYNDGANGLQKLDYVIYKAGQLGLKLIVVLTNHWQHMGGVPQYMTWYYLEHPYDFYNNDKPKQAYKDWAAHVITRQNTLTKIAYRNDPTIMAWELANEPHCDNVTTSLLTNWVTEMSSCIKELDPNHLVALGDEGFFDRPGATESAYNGSSGLDFEANLKVPTIDFGTYHLYPNYWKTTPEWGVQYIKDHINAGKAIGKPVILEEFGWQDDASKEKVYGMWIDTIYKENGAGWMFWRLVAPAENGTRSADSEHFDIYYPGSMATSFINWAQLFTKKTVSGSASASTVNNDTTPADFNLTAPGNGANAVSVTPAFSWQSSKGATSYELIVAADSSFNTVICNTVVTDTKFAPATPLSYGTTYYWKVTALNDSGKKVAANAGLSFTTETMPRANIIDDFEGYDGSNFALSSTYIRNKDGNMVKVSLDSENKNDGKYGLKYEYTLANPGFCGAVRQKLRNTNWEGATGIQLWLKPDGSDNYFTLQFIETNGEAWEYGIKIAGSKEAKMVQFPFEYFGKPNWCKVGNNKMDLRSISTFSIYMGKSDNDSTGVVYIDSIALVGNLTAKK
jgi:Endo-beta-mannanase